MHGLEGELGFNVTLCMSDANLCQGKYACMTRRKSEEVSIIIQRSSSPISGKGTCFIRGLPHTGMCHVDCVSFHEQITCVLKSTLDHFQAVLYTAARVIFLENKFGCCSPYPPLFEHFNSFCFLLTEKAIKVSYSLKVLQDVVSVYCPCCGNPSHMGHLLLLCTHTPSTATATGPWYVQFSGPESTSQFLL